MDKRRLRSRLRLQKALRDLMRESSPEDVSVETLARKAGVTRQTFYTHYGSISAMLDEYLDGLLDEMARRHAATFADTAPGEIPDKLHRHVTSVLTDLDAEDPRLGALLLGSAATDTERRLAALVSRFLEHGDPDGSRSLSATVQEVQAHYFAGAFLGLLRYWISLGPDRPPPDVMAGHFATFSLYGRKGQCLSPDGASS
ncbi:hypothetical protein OCH239_05420 [Roseivivax halodurans JCM 10272]|uniref:HTH tetR-type domain-containing protein n=1 Tax=Roseivivax halodurans JCM 10272 TaxID=1449350 RepID=X7EFS1_9RHOB|nr:TetR/AcrR family transcriptional regulator [Roseivivax halodurans]ETX14081.1 hypothetical protein OCH239_05420 [Roseivivax halodurans JCM 10272]